VGDKKNGLSSTEIRILFFFVSRIYGKGIEVKRNNPIIF